MARERLERALFWVTAVATAAPLWATRFLPMTDVPEHVAVISTIARLMPGGGGAPYTIAYKDSQYLLYDIVGALLARLLGDAVLANKVLLTTVAVMWPVSMRSLLRALGRDERVAIFAAMVFWNRATVVGLEPYVASVPLALFCLARAVHFARVPTRARGAVIAVLALLLFYTHVSSYLLFAVTAMALTFVVPPGGRPRLLAMIRAAVALVPSAFAALLWWRAGSLSGAGLHPGSIDRMAVGASVSAMPIWTFDIWRSHVDEVCAAIWWCAYAFTLVASWPKNAPVSRLSPLVAWTPFACGAALYLTTPWRVGEAAMLNTRLAPVLTLFALVGLALRRDRWGRIPIALAASAALITSGNAFFEIRRVSREKLGDFEALLAKMRPGTSVASLNFERASPRTYFQPYVFAGSYHRAQGGDVASFSFTELPHWPLHYEAGFAPPVHRPFWAFWPCEYRYREDGAYYDYVLVQGDVDVFGERRDGAGPPFTPIATAGRFTLYEKAFGPELPDGEPDHGPCRPPPNASGTPVY